jgi:hypothetical protein
LANWPADLADESLPAGGHLDPTAADGLQFSILEILPATSTPNDAIAKENLWKHKLGSRTGGYNHN